MSVSRRDFLAAVGLLSATPSWVSNLSRDTPTPSAMDSFRWVLDNRDVTFVAYAPEELDYIATLSDVSDRLEYYGASTRGVTMSKPITVDGDYKYAFGLDVERASIDDWRALHDAVLDTIVGEVDG